MDNSRTNLLELVEEQKKTIEKYSNKLRDVVAAHRSLLIEKKALEDTIKILNESKSVDSSSEISKDASDTEDKEKETGSAGSEVTSETDLKNQLSSVLASFSNLVSEKSHMEECFKANQKQLLEDKEAVEKTCKELQDQVKLLVKELKSQENKNEFGLTRKDSKRNLRVKSLKQLDDGHDDKLENELLTLQVKNYEKEVKNLRSELDAKRLVNESYEKKLKESTLELIKLQDELRNIQIEHQMAIQHEKERAKDVEEHAKKLTAIQEERVVNLETRLAELSETIGTYDRLRLQDQAEIHKLKEHIAYIGMGPKSVVVETNKSETINSDDYHSLLEKMMELKNKMQVAAKKCGKEEDFKNLFFESHDNDNDNDNVHITCKDEYNKLKNEFESFKSEVKLYNGQTKSGKEMIGLQNQVKNLQEKVRLLNDKNKEIEKDYQLQVEQLKKTIKNEKSRFKETLSASETDFRGRVWLLEEQLQKQRERSLALLEEKEQEIHSLQSTFQMFLPGYRRSSQDETGNNSNMLPSNQFAEGPHIVHYANELARRDIEISSLRRSKHQIDLALRELQKQVASEMEKYKDEKESLCEKIARLERCQTREGANLEYLKNVVYSFLLSNDPKSKRHMYNAIAAVLRFSESELQKVIDHSRNSWWTRSNYLS